MTFASPVVSEPGAFLGEISAVLGSAPTGERGGHPGQHRLRDRRRVRVGARAVRTLRSPSLNCWPAA